MIFSKCNVALKKLSLGVAESVEVLHLCFHNLKNR